ncbi:PadR family transcriptional regulator [Candidatus Leptofilum sp.]|uniref:PadR family transcriptional regulator n=1 Tax=Candidatus Leptofilum sp. TaxID=3241576 RepID=UPI003B5C97EB
MKLEYLILGLLKMNPRTGYDIKKYLDTEGRFGRARAPLSQIYTTLKRMTHNSWVIFEEEVREGKPDAKIYHNTDIGEKVLIDYLHSPVEPSFRIWEGDILYRVIFAFLVEPEVILEKLRTELAFRQDQIAKFRNRDRTTDASALSKEQTAYAQEIYEMIHSNGAKSIDAYVLMLEEMIVFFEDRKN